MRPYHKRLMLGLSGGGLRIRGVTFDGSNDYLTRGADYTGNANGKTGIISFWVKKNADAEHYVFQNDGNYVDLRLKTDGTVQIQLVPLSGSGTVLNMSTSAGAVTNDGNWHHILMSWSIGSSLGHLYIDDVNAKASDTYTNNDVDYTRSQHSFGATTTGTSKLSADVAAVYMNLAAYLDFSVTANRRKFVSANGYPVNLGADGSLPTGTAPILFLHLADGAAVSTFATNKGSGGGMTLTGTLTEAATKPHL